MKKLLALLMIAAMLLTVVACGQSDNTTTKGGTQSTTGNDTSEPNQTTESGVSTTGGSDSDTGTTTDVPTTNKPDPTTTELRGNVIAKINKEEWKVDENINYRQYTYLGIGSGFSTFLKEDPRFKSYTITYKLYDKEADEYKNTTITKISTLSAIGVAFKELNTQNKTATAYVDQLDVKVHAEYTQFNVGFGALIVFRFKTNVPTKFIASIGDKPGATNPKSGTYLAGIVPEGSNGEYVGRVSLVVPHNSKAVSYINFYIDNLNANYPYVNYNVPIITDQKSFKPDYELEFTGDWAMIKQDRYIYDLHELFYNVYARLYARWGTGSEPKKITFRADYSYDGIAYASGTSVTVSVNYANANPYDIGFFSHEITHSVQQFNFVYGENVQDGYNQQYGKHNAWFTENMANYGGFRYFHWADSRWVQVYQPTDVSLQDWGYHPYGNNKWFFAYMDYKYPTLKKADGSRDPGLLDTLVTRIKQRKLDTDRPNVPETKFNQTIKEVTGLATMEALRQQFVAELKAGTFNFKGFRDYPCNFMTEGLRGVPDPDYPMVTSKTHGDKTAAALPTVIKGKDGNLVIGASIHRFSGQTKEQEAVELLIDGNENTKWCATPDNVVDKYYQLQQVPQFVIIDLGEKKTFNTYTIINAGDKEIMAYNTREWEICISDDAREWTSIDYQNNNNKSEVSFNVGQQSARYILIKVFGPMQQTNGNTVRIYEFGLYNVQ